MKVNFWSWFNEAFEYFISNAGGLVYFETLQNKWPEVKRTTLLSWLDQAESGFWITKIQLQESNKSVYSIHPMALERLRSAEGAINGAV